MVDFNDESHHVLFTIKSYGEKVVALLSQNNRHKFMNLIRDK